MLECCKVKAEPLINLHCLDTQQLSTGQNTESSYPRRSRHAGCRDRNLRCFLTPLRAIPLLVYFFSVFLVKRGSFQLYDHLVILIAFKQIQGLPLTTWDGIS